ncbi:MAG: hypothetical protein AAGH78_10760 [Cyanobacteria bacterium P01_H01_bin.58]
MPNSQYLAQAQDSKVLPNLDALTESSSSTLESYERLERYSLVEDAEVWYPVLYEDQDFARLEAFINRSLQNEQTDEQASAYLGRLYHKLAEPPAHADKVYTEADNQQLSHALTVLDAWIQQFPDSHIPYLIRGTLLLNHGWQIRGESLAWRVPQEAWPQLYSFLEQSKADLDIAAGLNPQDPNVWSALLNISKGLSLPESVWQTYFEQGIAANPYHIQLWGQKALLLMPQWQGNKERVLALARECQILSQADNKPLLALVTLSIHRSIDSHERGGHLSRPEIWREMQEIYSRIFSAYPNNPRMHWFYAYDAMQANQGEIAAEQLAIVGDRWTNGTPWRSIRQYNKARANVFYVLATMAYSEGDYQNAEQLAAQSAELRPTALAYLLLTEIHGKHYQDGVQATYYAQRALAAFPSEEERQIAEETIFLAETELMEW